MIHEGTSLCRFKATYLFLMDLPFQRMWTLSEITERDKMEFGNWNLEISAI